MSIIRVGAIILRFLMHFRHSLDRLIDVFYWPILDLLLLGLTSLYFAEIAGENGSQITLILVAGVIFWLIVYRSQYELSGNLLEEMWNKNLLNLFVSPLTFWEWLTALLLIGLIKSALSFSFAALLAFLLYKIQILAYGPQIIPFAALLLLTGWWLGFIIAGLLMRYGTRIQAFAWTAVWAIAPFSGLYYPISVLPDWAQKIAAALPTSYIFEGIRETIMTGTMDPAKFWTALILNLVYLTVAIVFLRLSFGAILKKGLAQLH